MYLHLNKKQLLTIIFYFFFFWIKALITDVISLYTFSRADTIRLEWLVRL